jgi:short-subunit dehydrogenase
MVKHRRGSIILMSSMRAVNVEPGQSIYAATKAGIGQMTRGLAHDQADALPVDVAAGNRGPPQ